MTSFFTKLDGTSIIPIPNILSPTIDAIVLAVRALPDITSLSLAEQLWLTFVIRLSDCLADLLN
jgi:hypothetical protein